ncbi:MAG: class I SAM-dependent methyltransferase [Moorea sp. SIO4A3]|nr:class I SAM-dependent methyltransferase [Moorena sp. SIO4A3]
MKTEQSPNIFESQWQLYQKILTNNYMQHREIYGILHAFLVSYFPTPFSILDLGCGDASFTAQALANTTIASYKGIDLSEPALEIARDNMNSIPCEQTLIQGDFFEVVSELGQKQQDSFDGILSSFAFHHLSFEQKDGIMAQLSHLLKADGVFILIDIVSTDGETRDTYLRRYLEGVYQDWAQLTPEEVSMVEGHILSSDFPETQTTLQSLAHKHDFNRVECLYRDPLNTSQVLCFYKSSAKSPLQLGAV